MKNFIVIAFILCMPLCMYAQIEVSPREADKIVASISRINGPDISGRYVYFTAPGSFRYAGIAFEHERYQIIHHLERVVTVDYNGQEVHGSNHYLEDNYLLYAMEIPLRTGQIKYRMVFDGLWTVDPLNENTSFDSNAGLETSVIEVPYLDDVKTELRSGDDVRFVYEGEQGLQLTVCGTFNNWDPYMYEMTEIRPGVYQLDLPLPAGTYYYTFMNGTMRYPDKNNPERVYTDDGRVASVINVRG